MTRNQIDYQKLVEGQRSNLAQEELTRMRDLRNYRIAQETLAENTRHNRVYEDIQASSLDESIRHNRAVEVRELAALTETSQHNRASESIEFSNAAERQRANLALENETRYAHRVGESETRRFHDQSLALSQRQLDELREYHSGSLGVQSRNIDLGYADLSERQRANLASEQIRSSVNEEAVRHNITLESLQQQDVYTRERSQANQRRHDIAVESETKRANQVREAQGWTDTIVSGANTIVKAIPLFGGS